MKTTLFIILSLFASTVVAEQVTTDSKKVWDLLSASITVNEWNYKSLNDQLEFDWSANTRLLKQENFDFDFSYTSHYDKQVDPFDDITVREEEKVARLNFDINRLWGILGITLFSDFNQKKINQLYETKYDISTTVGLKLDLIENKVVTELSLSYLPIYNYLEFYYLNEDFDGNKYQDKYIQRSIQHSFRMNITTSFNNGKFSIGNETWWKEIKPLDETNTFIRDFIFTNSLSFQYRPSQYISFGYVNSIIVDKQRREIQNLPGTDHQSSIRFGLHWN